MAWVVTRQVVLPVRRAAVVAERLASGRLNERMRTRGADELAMLGKSFNEMADSLQNQIRQLEGLSRVQQRFVSDVSHELRTPLTTIRMAADLIHDSRTGFDPAVARSAELLQAELDRFEELLGDLLEISRFDAGAAALDAEATDLRDAVAHAVESSKSIADRRGSTVSVKAEGDCVAEIDSRRVERILRNLVVNAVEHGEGRPVEIEVARERLSGGCGGPRPRRRACGPGRAPWCSTGSGARTPPAPAPPAAPAWGWRSRSRTRGCTTGGCRRGASPASARASGSRCRRRVGVPIDESPLPLSPDAAAEGAGGATRARGNNGASPAVSARREAAPEGELDRRLL